MSRKAPSDSSADFPGRLANDVISCQRCPRLIAHCQTIAKEKRKAFAGETYWGRPVPNFAAPSGQLLIVGLAPAAHGANRTGRMFTGDNSGRWLYRALHRRGFANQAECEAADDGLNLKNAVITAIAHCAPPDNKPTPEEIANCSEFLVRTLQLYQPRVIVALGALAWNQIFTELKARNGTRNGAKARPKFSHLAEVEIGDGTIVLGSFHPSQQNTFTGRLTEDMLDAVFTRAREILFTKPKS